jgi:hypothetical protein
MYDVTLSYICEIPITPLVYLLLSLQYSFYELSFKRENTLEYHRKRRNYNNLMLCILRVQGNSHMEMLFIENEFFRLLFKFIQQYIRKQPF